MIEQLVLDEIFGSIQPLKPFKPLKPAEGYGSYEFDDIDDVIENFVKKAFEAGERIFVQPKWDGIRLLAHKYGDEVRLFTEDKSRDRSEVLPLLAEAIKALPVESVILDGECLLGEINESGMFVPRPRPDAMKIIAGKEPVTLPYRFFVFDVWYLDGNDLSDLPYEQRFEHLRGLVRSQASDLIVLTETKVVDASGGVDAAKSAIAWAASVLGSEGAMLKFSGSTYRASGRTTEWAKYKEWKALKAIVIGISKVFPPGTSEKDYKQAFKNSQVYVFRAAILGPDGKTLIPLRAKKKVTESDLILRRVKAGEEDPVTGHVASKDEWRGRDDPQLWKMMEGFDHPKPGDWAYATTYAIKLEREPNLGDTVEVAAIGYQCWVDEETGEILFSWMHPRVKNVEPDEEPTRWEKFVELLEASGYSLPKDYRLDGSRLIVDSSAKQSTLTSGNGSHICTPFVTKGQDGDEASDNDEVSIGRMYPRLFKEAFGAGLPRIVVKACVELLPDDYDTYVELFAGVGGGLLRAKPRRPGETEILIDIDPFLVAFLKVLKSGDWRKLTRFRWSPDKKRWLELCEAVRNGEFDDAPTLKKAYLFAYSTFYTNSNYGFHGTYSPKRKYTWRKDFAAFLSRCALWEQRLKGVRIYCMDAFDALEKFDSKRTFFFADPPWITPASYRGKESFYNFGWSLEDHNRFIEACKDLKGKIMILNQAFARKFLSLGDNWTYRALNFVAKIPPWIVNVPENVDVIDDSGPTIVRRTIYIIGNWDMPDIPRATRKQASELSAADLTEKGILEDEELTHEEQRELEEARFGDPYLVIHDTKNYEGGYKFVYMRHYRGLWSDDERKAIDSLLQRWDEASSSEKEKIWDELVRRYNVYRLKVPIAALIKRARAASEERADVSKVIKECITQDPPARNRSAEEIAGEIINLASVHGDLRIENPASPETQLIGWTLATPAVAVQFLDGTIVPILRDKFLNNQDGDRIVAIRKARQPHVWLTVVTAEEPILWVPPKAVGATSGTWALFEWKANGVAWFGMQRRDFHEMFLLVEEADDDVELPSGKWIARLLSGKGPKVGGDGDYWQFWYPEDDGQLPYVLTHTPQQAKKEWKDRKYDVVILNLDVVPIVVDVFEHIGRRVAESEKFTERLANLDDWSSLEKIPEK